MKSFTRILFVALIFSMTSCASLESAYQRDADLFRISHLIHYGDLLGQYHDKVGHYPFQDGSDDYVQITFATDEQREYLNSNPDDSDSYIPEEFRNEIARVLGKEVELRFDPQRVPTTMPLYYLYAIDEGHYFFAIHLYNQYSFSTNRGPGFNHVEITDSDMVHEGFWKFEELIADHDFQAVASQLPERADWFRHQEGLHK